MVVTTTVLTVCRILGHFSRVWFGFSEIRWKPVLICLLVLIFLLGAVPACVVGALLFAATHSRLIEGLMAMMILVIVGHRRFKLKTDRITDFYLALGGIIVGGLSALVGTAGPVAAAMFLSLRLKPVGYVATEAMTGLVIHAANAAVYHSDGLIAADGLLLGAGLGVSMFIGTWCGKTVISSVAPERFALFIDVILLGVACQMLIAIVIRSEPTSVSRSLRSKLQQLSNDRHSICKCPSVQWNNEASIHGHFTARPFALETKRS